MAEITAPVRVRFAPSPTGFLHIGGVRAALFNWLFARHYGGQFILRIEDTDEKRYVPGAAADMMQSLRWVGLDWDEGPDIGGPYGPYVQSERKAQGFYQPYIDQLLASGHGYKSFVSEAELDQLRAEATARGVKAFRYRGAERDWTPEQVAAAEQSGKPYTVRLKAPESGAVSFNDLVRGGEQISFDAAQLQDIVLVKSSGMPVYHLAHLIDDHLMGVTHVLRGEEWVPSAPYHVLLYHAFGWQLPTFAHLPNIMRQDGKGKLSKRKDDVAANRFWEQGFLPEAMFNYLALQGWSYDDKTTIMSVAEIIERFSIERVQPSSARWNPELLEHLNGLYLRQLSNDVLAERLLPFLTTAGYLSVPLSDESWNYLRGLVPLIHERLKYMAEAPELLAFFFEEVRYDDLALLVPKKMDAAGTRVALERAAKALEPLEHWSEPQIEEELRALAEQIELKPGQLFGAIRVAITGRTVAPPLFETLAALGKQRSLRRISAAAAALGGS